MKRGYLYAISLDIETRNTGKILKALVKNIVQVTKDPRLRI